MTKLIFLGPPGAGKGTQGKILANKHNIPHISTGDILRKAVAEETPLGLKAKKFMDQGDLVPDDLILDLISECLQGEEAQKGWILDGFPRNVHQADFLNDLLHELDQKCQAVINLDVPDSELLKRLLSRGRKDDNQETIAHRLQVYREQTAPLIDYYEENNLLKHVDGDRPPEQVNQELEAILTS